MTFSSSSPSWIWTCDSLIFFHKSKHLSACDESRAEYQRECSVFNFSNLMYNIASLKVFLDFEKIEDRKSYKESRLMLMILVFCSPSPNFLSRWVLRHFRKAWRFDPHVRKGFFVRFFVKKTWVRNWAYFELFQRAEEIYSLFFKVFKWQGKKEGRSWLTWCRVSTLYMLLIASIRLWASSTMTIFPSISISKDSFFFC